MALLLHFETSDIDSCMSSSIMTEGGRSRWQDLESIQESFVVQTLMSAIQPRSNVLLVRLSYKPGRLHERDDPEPDRWHEDRRKKVHHGDLFHLKDAKAGC